MASKPVAIHVVYCGAWYDALVRHLQAKFPHLQLSFSSVGTPNATGWLEVEVDGVLVHSKKRGDGYIDSDAKLQRIFDAVAAAAAATS